MAHSIYYVANNGSTLWRFDPVTRLSEQVGPVAAKNISFRGSAVLYGLETSKLWLLDPETGQRLGQQPVVTLPGNAFGPLAISPSSLSAYCLDLNDPVGIVRVDLTTTPAKATRISTQIKDQVDGTIIYKNLTNAVFTGNGILYGVSWVAADRKYYLLRIDPGLATAARLFEVPDVMHLAFCCDDLYGVVPEGANNSGTIYQVLINQRTVAKLGQLAGPVLPEQIASRPGGLYAATKSGSLLAIDPKTTVYRNIGTLGKDPLDLAFGNSKDLYATHYDSMTKLEQLVKYVRQDPPIQPPAGTGIGDNSKTRWNKTIIGTLVVGKNKPYSQHTNGLAIATNGKIYCGTGLSGELIEIQRPAAGTKNCLVTSLGTFGQYKGEKLVCSGDLAHDSFGMLYAAVHIPSGKTNLLAQIDISTGKARIRIVGDTGSQSLFGLAFCCEELYGITGTGRFLKFDLQNGQARTLATYPGVVGWGMTGRPGVGCC